MAANVYRVLSAAVIVNANLFRGLEDAELGTTTEAIHASGKPVRFVTDMAPYTSMRAIKEAILNGTVTEEHLEFFANREVTDEEKAVIAQFISAKNALDDFLKGTSTYDMKPVPATWSFNQNITINKTSVKRNGYSMGIKAFEKLWVACLALWSTNQTTGRIPIRADGRDYTAVIEGDTIRVSCQTINRYEIEQVALRMGLSFVT